MTDTPSFSDAGTHHKKNPKDMIATILPQKLCQKACEKRRSGSCQLIYDLQRKNGGRIFTGNKAASTSTDVPSEVMDLGNLSVEVFCVKKCRKVRDCKFLQVDCPGNEDEYWGRESQLSGCQCNFFAKVNMQPGTYKRGAWYFCNK